MAQRQRYYAANPPARAHYDDDEEDLIDLTERFTEMLAPQPQPCIICMDDAEEVYRLPCKHYACASCIVTLFTRAKTCEINYPPTCCQTPACIKDYAEVFDTEFVRGYKERMVEYETPYAERTYCARAECAAFLPRDGEEEEVECAQCGTVTCHGCRGQKRVGEVHRCAAEEPDEAMKAWLLTQVTMKKCPCCETLIELKEACNHMCCELCGHEFCFICLAELQDNGCPFECELYGHPEVDEEGWCLAGFQRSRYERYGNDGDLHSGFHKDTGLDSFGYDRAGFHKDTGLNQSGYNREGVHIDDIKKAERLRQEELAFETMMNELNEQVREEEEGITWRYYDPDEEAPFQEIFEQEPVQMDQDPIQLPPMRNPQWVGMEIMTSNYGEETLEELFPFFEADPPPGYLKDWSWG